MIIEYFANQGGSHCSLMVKKCKFVLANERKWEFESGTPNDTPSVAGKIHEKCDFWLNELEPSSFIREVIQHKYSLPFHTPCPPFSTKNNASSRKNYDFVIGAIDELIQKKCVIQVESMPYCCNPLTVSDRKNKLRLVLDLRHVNKYIQDFSIKYEDLKYVEKIFEQGFYFETFDLTSGYHHVGINPEHWKHAVFS